MIISALLYVVGFTISLVGFAFAITAAAYDNEAKKTASATGDRVSTTAEEQVALYNSIGIILVTAGFLITNIFHLIEIHGRVRRKFLPY